LTDLMGKGHSLPGAAVHIRGNRRRFVMDSNRGKKEGKGKGRIMGRVTETMREGGGLQGGVGPTRFPPPETAGDGREIMFGQPSVIP
jgi:hypothetical protein